MSMRSVVRPFVTDAWAQFEIGAAKAVGLPQTELEKLILGVVNTALILAAVVALGYLAYGGFRYIASRGEENEVTAAKGTITYALIGLAVIGIAAALVNFVVGAVIGGGGGGPGDAPLFMPPAT